MKLDSKQIILKNDIDLNFIKTDKFKSNNISVYFIRQLNEDEVSMNTILPLILKRATKDLPSNLEVQRRLEELYGSSLGVSISKRGERQIIKFTMEFIADKYVVGSLAEEVIDLIYSVIYEPLLVDGVFKKSFVETEKENLRRRIKGKINDKRNFAIDRTLEEMCKDEPYSISTLGSIESVNKIDEKILYNYYLDFLKTSDIEIFYSGDYNDFIINHLSKKFEGQVHLKADLLRENIDIPIDMIKEVRESYSINQAKLVMGYRTYIPYEDDLYYPLLLGNEILGGGSSSKLFLDVREENSLAYYIGSSILKYKSILLVDSGIESKDYQMTKDIVNQKIQDMKDGKFNQEEMEVAKKSIISTLKSIDDSNYSLIEFGFGQSLSKDFTSPEDRIEKIKKVTREDIIKSMEKISLDTIYFMDVEEEV